MRKKSVGVKLSPTNNEVSFNWSFCRFSLYLAREEMSSGVSNT